MSFKKNKYVIIRGAIDKDLSLFLFNYFLMKKQVFDTFIQHRYISPYEETFGKYEDKYAQAPDTYCMYADIAMETLLLKCQPIMEKITKLKLYPNYSYARIYKNGDVLERHKDRFSCEISTTMNLGGDKWPIYINPNEEEGGLDEKTGKYIPSKNKGIKVDLNQGDMLVYRGNFLEHWRDSFKGTECGQVFLHYNDSKTPGSKDNIFDKRPHLGLPSWFKKG